MSDFDSSRKTAWLVERRTPEPICWQEDTRHFFYGVDWTINVDHAKKYDTREEAEAFIAEKKIAAAAVEHRWDRAASDFDIIREALEDVGYDGPAADAALDRVAARLAALETALREIAAPPEGRWMDGIKAKQIARAALAASAEAALARDIASLEHHGEFATTNYPLEVVRRVVAAEARLETWKAWADVVIGEMGKQREAAEKERDALREALAEMGVDMSAWDAAALVPKEDA